MENRSEVARLREHIRVTYEAAYRALNDPAFGTTKHAFISKRMEHIGEAHTKLKSLVGEQEATQLVIDTMNK